MIFIAKILAAWFCVSIALAPIFGLMLKLITDSTSRPCQEPDHVPDQSFEPYGHPVLHR